MLTASQIREAEYFNKFKKLLGHIYAIIFKKPCKPCTADSLENLIIIIIVVYFTVYIGDDCITLVNKKKFH